MRRILEHPRAAVVFQAPAEEAATARGAQTDWAARPVAERLRVIRGLRHRLPERASEIAAAAGAGPERPFAEVLSAEVLPLAEACRFLEREAARLLAPRRLGRRGRPSWLRGVTAELRREPLGLVLILAPSNYPLFLPGVQALQALAAGNAVLWKPGRGGLAAARALTGLLRESGLDERLVRVLPATDEAGRAALAAGVDKVLLTGSSDTGRAVLRDLAGRLTPATAELSGCDPLFVLPGADLDRVARAVRFGLTLNRGATCIAPRRVFVPRGLARELEERLAGLLTAPELLVPVASTAESLELAGRSPYALGASIFGPEAAARALARRVKAGVVTINDVIVPTADPRLPFGGRGESGFGLTRGGEGLLELTAVKVVATRRGRWLPHLEERTAEDGEILRSLLALDHAARWQDRLAAAVHLLRAAVRRSRRSSREEVS